MTRVEILDMHLTMKLNKLIIIRLATHMSCYDKKKNIDKNHNFNEYKPCLT